MLASGQYASWVGKVNQVDIRKATRIKNTFKYISIKYPCGSKFWSKEEKSHLVYPD